MVWGENTGIWETTQPRMLLKEETANQMGAKVIASCGIFEDQWLGFPWGEINEFPCCLDVFKEASMMISLGQAGKSAGLEDLICDF